MRKPSARKKRSTLASLQHWEAGPEPSTSSLSRYCFSTHLPPANLLSHVLSLTCLLPHISVLSFPISASPLSHHLSLLCYLSCLSHTSLTSPLSRLSHTFRTPPLSQLSRSSSHISPLTALSRTTQLCCHVLSFASLLSHICFYLFLPCARILHSLSRFSCPCEIVARALGDFHPSNIPSPLLQRLSYASLSPTAACTRHLVF